MQHIVVLLLTVTLALLVLLIFLHQRMRFQLFRIYEIVTKLYSSQAYHRHLQNIIIRDTSLSVKVMSLMSFKVVAGIFLAARICKQIWFGISSESPLRTQFSVGIENFD